MAAEHVEAADDPKAALAAIRIVGADLFAPCLLRNTALHPKDAAAVEQSFTVFPAAVTAPPPPPEGPAEPWLIAWQDWATATLLAHLTDSGPGMSGAVLAPRPAGAPVLGEPGLGVAAGTAPATDSGTGWQRWSVRMGQLAPLALPRLEGPVQVAARAAPLALARGASRAVLRRDFPTAARIVRWLALLSVEGVPVPLDPAPLVEHLRLHGGGPRLALDVAIAGRLLALETP
ncbi:MULTISPECIES: hypothetical protein [Streptomyces]|uniref:hypothetical protein n=1 Tax=Streptomyces TaxID=1883 RepID=UPI001E3F6A65|nr:MULTISPECIES: hypothetical protein [Streptomyces]UFQ19799.1 hypothetical protein J2N69_35270 [Streptomyces huasconensis]WCL89421.1 hypothetical protein PPN52_35210 [Streptomyces sp. JCM 35825]